MNIQFLTPTIHGILDYIAASVLIVAPVILNLGDVSPLAYWLSIVAGGLLILYSLLTDYAFSISKVIPFKVHLGFDLSAGVIFVIWPFIFGFSGLAMMYYVVMGLGIMLVVAVTEPESHSSHHPHHITE
tara:strand:+ start:77 stop:463 length:387 start_codon:yes stop_codon:yes gene_type:complete